MDFFEYFEKRMKQELNAMQSLFKETHMEFPEFKETAVDITETEKHIIVAADMPGIKKEDINLIVNKESISIKAERKSIEVEEKKGMYKQERTYKGYNVFRTLPVEVKPETAKAEYKDGVVRVEIEKAEAAKEKEKIGKKVKVA
jgi:HSP20 family protein